MHEERYATDSSASVQDLRAVIAEQAKLIEQLCQRVAELEARLAKDSHNSSKPPSSDPPFRKPPPRSQRKASGLKPGGQKGHKGATRALVEEPDHLVVMAHEGACTCGRCRSQIESLPAPAPAGARIGATFPGRSVPRCNTDRACVRSRYT